MLQYADHHIFTIDDLRDIRQQYSKMNSQEKVILTTEKDAVRLLKFAEEIKELPFYVVPVRHRFLFDEGPAFDKRVTDFINDFKKEE
jgi:tetraacyldisaccharide 4'-kinase